MLPNAEVPVMPGPLRRQPLHLLAWLNVLVHLVALALAALGMAPGSTFVELPKRLAYLAGYPPAWTLGWGSWMLSCLALIAFLAGLARALPGDAPRLAVVVAIAGGVVDLFCDLIQITALPLMAAQGAPATIFLAVERIAGAGGLVVANGCYTLAILLDTVVLREQSRRAPAVVWVGHGVVAFGAILTLAGFLDSAALAAAATGPTIGLYCVWVMVVARSVERSEQAP